MRKIIAVLLLTIMSLVFWQCSKEVPAGQSQSTTKGIPVSIMELKTRPFSEYLNVTGTVEARNRIQIIVEEGGTLDRVVKDKGSVAKKGDTLAVLENKILRASFNEARSALRQAELDYNSKKVLYDKRAISENEYLASRYGLERAQAAYELAKARYSKLFITAPLNGYVNDRFYDIGAYATPMTAIFDFIDNEYMIISAGVAERFLNDIEIGTPVDIVFDAFPDLQIESQVSFIHRSIDPQSRTFEIEVQIPNPDRKLAPQMIANLKILRRSYENQIVIPLDAVIETEQGRFVYLEKDRQALKMPISLKAIYQDSALVEGLQPDQKLVVVGQQQLTDGDSLMVKQESFE